MKLLCSLLLGCAIGFGVVEALDWLSIAPLARNVYVRIADPVLGYRYKPHSAFSSSTEGNNRATINSFGFPDREHLVEKPSNTIRVAVLGDSYIEALGIPQRTHLSSLLEKKLNTHSDTGKHYEVIAAGLGGWGLSAQVVAYRERIAILKPDMVIALINTNDFIDNWMSNYVPIAEETKGHVRYEYRGDYDPARDRHFKSAGSFLLNQMKKDLKAYAKDRFRVPGRSSTSNSLTGVQLLGKHYSLNVNVLDNPDLVCDPQIRIENRDFFEAVSSLSGKIINDLNRSVQGNGGRLFVFLLPFRKDVYPTNSSDTDCVGWNRYLIEQIRQESNVNVIDLTIPTRQALAQYGILHFMGGTGHWNTAGHRFMANLLSEYISPKQRVPQQ